MTFPENPYTILPDTKDGDISVFDGELQFRASGSPEATGWNAGNDKTDGEVKQLSELMGYSSKQRSEYRRARKLASEAAYPLVLDKAWRLYSKSERDAAVESVFEAFKKQYTTRFSTRLTL